MKIFNWISGAVAVIGTFIVNLFGGWSDLMTTLCIFMLLDLITGLIVAIVFKKSNKTEQGTLSSSEGLKGIIRKGIVLIIVYIAHLLDTVLNLNYIMNGVIFAYLVVELISIVENCGLMGIPIPKILAAAIELLKEKEGDSTEDNSNG